MMILYVRNDDTNRCPLSDYLLHTCIGIVVANHLMKLLEVIDSYTVMVITASLPYATYNTTITHHHHDAFTHHDDDDAFT